MQVTPHNKNGARQQIPVYVLNADGTPLMPTTSARARRMLDKGKAVVAIRMPFTIQLTYQIDDPQTQEVVVGLDTGSKALGVAAVGNGTVLFAGEVQLRTFAKHNGRESAVAERAMLRRSRWSRKTRYRKPRFLNRPRTKCKGCGGNTPKSSRKGGGRAKLCRPCAQAGHPRYAHIDQKPGWISPTLRSKKHWHVRAVKDLGKLLPVSRVVVEIADWDIQKIRNPDLEGEAYQQGELRGYENARSYVLARDEWKCLYCRGESGDCRLTADHIVPRSRGGTNRPDNLATACRTCNDQKGNRTAEEWGRPDVQRLLRKNELNFKHMAHVGAIKTHVLYELSQLWSTDTTYGYLTRIKRRDHLGLPKCHAYDAVAVALEWGETADPTCLCEARRQVSPVYSGRVRARGRRQRYNTQPVKANHPQKPELIPGKGWFIPKERNTQIVARDGTIYRKGDWIQARVGSDHIRGHITALYSSGAMKVQVKGSYRRVSPNRACKLQSRRALMWQ